MTSQQAEIRDFEAQMSADMEAAEVKYLCSPDPHPFCLFGHLIGRPSTSALGVVAGAAGCVLGFRLPDWTLSARFVKCTTRQGSST